MRSRNLLLTTPPLSINLILVEEMTPKNIHIKVNEKEILISSNTSLFQLKNQFKPNTDVIIYNSFPVNSDCPLIEGDEIVFIKKGELPSDRKSTRLNSSHGYISYAVFCLKK